jgi:branched-chain amino acid transport system permease protein
MAIGGYTAALLTIHFSIPWIPAMIIGIIVAGFVAYLLGSLTLKLKGDYFLIATLGFGMCITVLFNYLSKITGGAMGLSGIPQDVNMWWALGNLALAIIISWTLIHSKYGRNFTAIRENEVAAEAVGINTTRYKKMAFVYSAMLAGWAGALTGYFMMYLNPSMFALAKSSELTIVVVIGGLGSITGSILASIVIVLLPEVFRSLANYSMLFYGLAVVLIVILRPSGLLGYKEFSITKLFAFIKRLFTRRNVKGAENR